MLITDWIRRLRPGGVSRLTSRPHIHPEPVWPEEEEGTEVGPDVPRICLVTPVFNGADYIDETIHSVVSQAGNFVLHYHVQDGGSTDGTMARVEEWKRLTRALPRLCRKLVFTSASERDGGMYDAINRAFARALPPGDDVVMGWIAADDRIAPGAFAAITEIRRTFPETRFLGGRISLIDHHGGIIGVHSLIPFSQRCMTAGLYDGRALNFVMQEGTFWCADLWRKIGGLDARFRLAGDWDLWRRLAAHAPYVSADTILGFHRRRPGQLSEQMNSYYAEVDATLDGTRGDAVEPSLASAARGGRLPGSLREAYDDIAIEHELIRRDPPRFRASQHSATVIRYNLDAKTWERTSGFGMVPGAPDLVTPAGTTESRSVRFTRGFKAAEGPYPEHGLPVMIRWMSGPVAEGELSLERSGRYRLTVRCRSWTPGQRVTLLADGQPLGTLAVTPHEHDRDLLLCAEATLGSGPHVLALRVDEDAGRYLLVIDWLAERLQEEDRATLLPVPPRPIGLASRGIAPPGGWPRISLVVPTRNHGVFIGDTLASIVRQGYPNLELIVVDGASSDQTGRILRTFAPHITFLLSEADRGQSDAINKGFRAASGEILSWLNSDDLLADGALHAIAHAFRNGGGDIIAGACEVFDDRNLVLHRHLPCLADAPLPLGELLDLENHWLRGQFFHQPELFFTREIWERAGGWVDEALYFSMDYDLWVRMALAGATIRTIGAPVARYRLHPAQKTSTPEAYRPELTRHAAAWRERLGLGVLPTPREMRTRLRIVVFNDCGFRYGAGIAHRRLSEALAALGHDVIPLAYADFYRGAPTGSWSPDAVASAIADERPDLVIVGNLHVIAADFDLLGALVARGLPAIFYAHDEWIVTGRCAYPGDCRRYLSSCNAECPTAERYPALPPALVAPAFARKRRTIAVAAAGRCAILTNSRYMQRMLEGVLGESGAHPAVHVAPIGIDTARFVRGDRWRARMLLELSPDAFIVMIAAADLRDERKGFGLLLDALALLDGPAGVTLLVLGSTAPLPDLPCDWRATGYLDDEDLVALHYQAADLFVGPSLEEAFGQTFLEAGACEIPSVAFDVGGIADALLHDTTGLLVEERSAAALARAISRLRDDPALRRALGAQARLHVVNRFSLEASAAALTGILVRDRALEMALSPNVSVAAAREAMRAPRFLVESDAPAALPPMTWYPRRNLVEERQPFDRPDLPVRFWWATSPGCVFLLPATSDGQHVLQLTVRNQSEGQQLSLSVNGGEGPHVDLSAHDLDVVQTVQVAVDLVTGFNRVEISFSRHLVEETGPRRSLALLIEDVCAFEGSPRGADGLADGTVELMNGFGPLEGPYPEHGLPVPIRWVVGRRCTLRLFTIAAGRRCWELSLRNDRPHQALRILVNNLPVVACTLGEPSLQAVQRVRFTADMLAGANTVVIEADSVLESSNDPRPLAFIFEEVQACRTELPEWDADDVRWDLSEGLAPPQPADDEGGGSVRSVTAAVVSIVVERGQRGPARLLLDARAVMPRQSAFLLVNGRAAGRLDFAAADGRGDVSIDRDITLVPGRNTLQLQFTAPAWPDGPFAGSLLLVRALTIEQATGPGQAAVPGTEQKWRCLDGFSDIEAPVPELGLPKAFRWALAGDSLLRFSQPISAATLLVHNDFVDQVIEVFSEEGALLASEPLLAELSVLQEVPLVVPHAPTRGLRLRAQIACPASEHDPRRRCFILEGITDPDGHPYWQAS